MTELRVVLIHYHLMPGGVASVIRDGLVALAGYGGWSRVDVRVLTGSSLGLRSFAERLQAIEPHRIRLQVEVSSLLGYRNRDWSSHAEFTSQVEETRKWISEQCRQHRAELLWVHNPTLGKNPALTAALTTLTQEEPSLRVLYHLHDFAECSRFANLEFLRRYHSSGSSGSMYPIVPNLNLITLTEADRMRLIQAGYPQDSVTALADPVVINAPAEAFSREERSQVDRHLAEWSRRRGFSFQPGCKWLLAPVRTIRRKNILELAILCALLGEDWQLLVTLDCNSEPERPYAEMVKECFRRLSIHAILGFGASLKGSQLSFNRLYASADAIGTTAVLEGFGLVFAESTLQKRPLLGRNLPDVTNELEGLPRKGLYDSLQVPLECAERKQLLEQYHAKIACHASALEFSPEVVDQVQLEFERLFEKDWLDFSYLDLPAQVRICSRLEDRAFRDALLEHNPTLAEIVSTPPQPPTESECRQMEQTISLERFAQKFQAILDSPAGSVAQSQQDLSGRLIERYFQPPFLRLLLDAGDDWRLWRERLLPRHIPAPNKSASIVPQKKADRSLRRVVLWDVYGTLLISTVGDLEQRLAKKESPEPYFDALQKAGFNIAHPAGNPAEVFHQLIAEDHERSKSRGLHQPEVVIEDIWQRLIERILPGQWATPLQARFISVYFELNTNPSCLREEAGEIIEELHRLGYAQGILSNAQFYTGVILRHALGEGIWSLLHPELLFWSYQMGVAKPDPAPFSRARAMLKRKAVPSSHVIMIGDNYANDIIPAKQWGWRTIQLTASGNSPACPSADSQSADYHCESLNQVYEVLKAMEF